MKRTFVFAKGEEISRPYFDRCLADPAWTVHVTNQGGHDQVVDDPETVAEILKKAAA